MKKTKRTILGGALVAAALTIGNGSIRAASQAQIQTTGTPGSPSATTTISGQQLPAPDPKFGGVIKDSAPQSKPWWPPNIVPPKARPTCCSS